MKKQLKRAPAKLLIFKKLVLKNGDTSSFACTVAVFSRFHGIYWTPYYCTFMTPQQMFITLVGFK